MIIRSKAPLRIGLAGGGSDVAPYSDVYGGSILNATISLYAYATILPRSDDKIVLHAHDKNERHVFQTAKNLPADGKLDLIKGVYNRVIREYNLEPLSFELTTFVDAAPGSGLGTSSTLCIAVLGAFTEWLKLPLGEYDIARMAYEIERIDLGMSGGKQDQYAATFCVVNFMEFYADEKVIVNPLRIRRTILDELNHNLVLFWTETSRLSAKIIEEQQQNVRKNIKSSVEAMHKIKEQAVLMKEVLLKGDLDKIGEILDYSWEYKRNMATSIVTPELELYYDIAKQAGASGGKISGAGGGGFMFFYCPENTRNHVINALSDKGGMVKRYEFTPEGLKTWTFNN